MLLSVMKYGALSGKTRAMFGRLLKNNDYREMMQKKSVSDIASYLKYSTHFSAILAEEDEAGIHRGHLENILKHEYINDYAKLMKFATGDIRKFINIMFLKIEIESLKLLFRVFEAGNVQQEILEESLLFLTRYEELNIPKLALSRNLHELLAGLQGTGYYELLRPFLSSPKECRLFNLEMALDLYYFRSLQDNFLKLLSGKDRQIAGGIIGMEMDMFNLFWIYRSKLIYQTDKELIYSYILPHYHKISRKVVDSLIAARNADEFMGVLKDTDYGPLFSGEGPGIFEHHYQEMVYRVHKKKFRQDNFSIACIISYLRLKEVELNNIISIIEGIRYKLPPEEIEKYIIGYVQQ